MRRDEWLKDNVVLLVVFVNKVGDLLYGKLVDGFEGENFNVFFLVLLDFLVVSF